MDRPIVGHVLAALVALGLVPAGLSKLAGVQMMVDHFAQWGYPWFFVYLTGALELLASGLAVYPKTRLYGAGLAVVVMVGAVATHVLAGELDQVAVPLVIGLFAAATAWTARPR